MLEVYYFETATCPRKVRLVLEEKSIPYAKRRLNRDAGDLRTPHYLSLNPNGYVPTLVHDGRAITESTVIMNYIEDCFPEPTLRPADPFGRMRMNLWLKWADEKYLGALFPVSYVIGPRREMLRQKSDEELAAHFAGARGGGMLERIRLVDMIRNGPEGDIFKRAVRVLDKMLVDMEAALTDGSHLAGKALSLADCAITPFLARLSDLQMSDWWVSNRPRVTDWFEGMRARPSYRTVIEVDADPAYLEMQRMGGAELWSRLQPILPASE